MSVVFRHQDYIQSVWKTAIAAGTLDKSPEAASSQVKIWLEERFNHKIANDALQNEYNFNFWFRYLLKLKALLNRDFLDAKTLFFAFNDEIHIMSASRSRIIYLTKTVFL